MLSRILLGIFSAALGGILVIAAAAGSEDGASVTAAASAPLPELTVAPPTDYPDVRITNGDAASGSAVFDPADPRRLVVGIVVGSKCYVKRSTDGGKTWGALVELQQLATAECSPWEPPDMTYAAEGGRLYAAYSAYPAQTPEEAIVEVSMSADQGVTWSTPRIVMSERYCYDSCAFYNARIAAAPDGPWVYVAAVSGGHHWGDLIMFSRSGDRGLSWSPAEEIASGDEGLYLGSFALAAGRSGKVLVAYGLENRFFFSEVRLLGAGGEVRRPWRLVPLRHRRSRSQPRPNVR